jgi:hypothetical protein
LIILNYGVNFLESILAVERLIDLKRSSLTQEPFDCKHIKWLIVYHQYLAVFLGSFDALVAIAATSLFGALALL